MLWFQHPANTGWTAPCPGRAVEKMPVFRKKPLVRGVLQEAPLNYDSSSEGLTQNHMAGFGLPPRRRWNSGDTSCAFWCKVRPGGGTMAVFLMVSPELSPTLRGRERASRCIPAPRDVRPPESARSRRLRMTGSPHAGEFRAGRYDARCPSPRGGTGRPQDDGHRQRPPGPARRCGDARSQGVPGASAGTGGNGRPAGGDEGRRRADGGNRHPSGGAVRHAGRCRHHGCAGACPSGQAGQGPQDWRRRQHLAGKALPVRPRQPEAWCRTGTSGTCGHGAAAGAPWSVGAARCRPGHGRSSTVPGSASAESSRTYSAPMAAASSTAWPDTSAGSCG